jgi:hypothetical protein
MRSGSCPVSDRRTRSGTTCDRTSARLPGAPATSLTGSYSPAPTQLKGRTMVQGRPYCCPAARAKYSTASIWNP